MGKVDSYKEQLSKTGDWDTYLKKESGLPGPRANLELMEAVYQTGTPELFLRYVALMKDQAVNSPDEYLALCGVMGLGRLVTEGRRECLETLRDCASDSRWRVRESTAMALQHYGDVDMPALLAEMEEWSRGNFLEKRAVVAALCEPRLLKCEENARAVIRLLDEITLSIQGIEEKKNEAYLVLKKALAYGWSVAAAALPEAGKEAMETWLACSDKEILWIMKENLKKDRLKRMDRAWVEAWQGRVPQPR